MVEEKGNEWSAGRGKSSKNTEERKETLSIENNASQEAKEAQRWKARTSEEMNGVSAVRKMLEMSTPEQRGAVLYSVDGWQWEYATATRMVPYEVRPNGWTTSSRFQWMMTEYEVTKGVKAMRVNSGMIKLHREFAEVQQPESRKETQKHGQHLWER